MRRAWVALIGALALLATAGCGAANDLNPDVVAQAASRTTGAGTARFSMVADVSGHRLDGSGCLDMRRHAVRMTTTLPGAGRVEEVVLGKTIYMRLPAAMAQKLPGGKPWVKIDLRRAAKSQGVNLDSLSSGPNMLDPSDALSRLRGAGDVTKLGRATVRGVPTTRYRAVVDLRKAADQAPPAQRAAARRSVEKLIKLTGQSTLPTQLWLDGAGRVRQVRWHQRIEGHAVDYTMQFFDFGARQAITAPPASEVQDMTDAASGGLGAPS